MGCNVFLHVVYHWTWNSGEHMSSLKPLFQQLQPLVFRSFVLPIAVFWTINASSNTPINLIYPFLYLSTSSLFLLKQSWQH